MKKFLLFLGAISLVLTASSQVDSLLRLCEKATEKQKSGLYLEIAFHTKTDSAERNFYLRKAYKAALMNNQIHEQAKAFYSLGETSYNSSDYQGAILFFEKALPLFKLKKDTLNMIDCYKSVGLCYFSMYQGEKAIAQFIEGMKLCEKDKKTRCAYCLRTRSGKTAFKYCYDPCKDA